MKVTKTTILRTIVLALALFNQVLAFLGKEVFPISEEEVYQYATAITTVLASVWAWWKNNSFTQEALAADEAMKEMKKDKKAEKKIKEEDEVSEEETVTVDQGVCPFW